MQGNVECGQKGNHVGLHGEPVQSAPLRSPKTTTLVPTLLQEERQAQLEEQARRKEIAAALKKKGEEEMTVRIALEMKRQMEVGGVWRRKAGSACQGSWLDV